MGNLSKKEAEKMLVGFMEKLEKAKGAAATSIIEEYEEDIRKLLEIIKKNNVGVSNTLLKNAKKLV
jgi:hypothetical protein